MQKETIKKLNELNRDFYKTVNTDFNESRQYFWAGWEKLLPYIKNDMRILDLGCGNGRFYEFVRSKGIFVDFVGMDSSIELLKVAQDRYPESEWQNFDLIENYAELKGKFDLIVSFGVFHHVPSFELRKSIIERLSKMTDTLVVSFWQFPKLKNLMKRQKVFNALGVDSSEIEDNDYLLDWQRGEEATRYCHWVDEDEVRFLMPNGKYFYADGKNQETNLYAILE